MHALPSHRGVPALAASALTSPYCQFGALRCGGLRKLAQSFTLKATDQACWSLAIILAANMVLRLSLVYLDDGPLNPAGPRRRRLGGIRRAARLHGRARGRGQVHHPASQPICVSQLLARLLYIHPGLHASGVLHMNWCACVARSKGGEPSYGVLMERFVAAVEEDYADIDFLVRPCYTGDVQHFQAEPKASPQLLGNNSQLHSAVLLLRVT